MDALGVVHSPSLELATPDALPNGVLGHTKAACGLHNGNDDLGRLIGHD
jgi:hypothetical protein